MANSNNIEKSFSDSFIQQVKEIITNAQSKAISAVNTERVIMYWKIGEKILLEEQNGKDRAEYGAFLIKNLTKELTSSFGSGFSQRQLETCRQFYKVFPIAHTLRAQLNWSQYKLLIRIDDKDKQTYYIEEACKNYWSARQLERQINSQLYERLLLSTNKEKVLAVAKGEAKPENPTIGILLCADKNNAVVELVLPENNNTILASKYQLYLPTKEEILKQVRGVNNA